MCGSNESSNAVECVAFGSVGGVRAAVFIVCSVDMCAGRVEGLLVRETSVMAAVTPIITASCGGTWW